MPNDEALVEAAKKVDALWVGRHEHGYLMDDALKKLHHTLKAREQRPCGDESEDSWSDPALPCSDPGNKDPCMGCDHLGNWRRVEEKETRSMKALFCRKCGDIRGLRTHEAVSCTCGNLMGWWLDPGLGTARFYVADGDRTSGGFIGFHNGLLHADYRQFQMDESFRHLHDQVTDAPGYHFDKSRKGCWAIVLQPGLSSDTDWADGPPEVEGWKGHYEAVQTLDDDGVNFNTRIIEHDEEGAHPVLVVLPEHHEGDLLQAETLTSAEWMARALTFAAHHMPEDVTP